VRAAAVIATLVALAVPGVAHAAFPGTNGLIVFTSAKHLFTVPAAGGPWSRLVADETRQAQAAWSPDGTRLAFRSGPDGDTEIWVVNADGSGLRQVTDTPNPAPSDPRYASQPSWTPDGRGIIFRSDQRDNNPDLYLVDANGGTPVPLVQTPGDDRYGAVSPDGTRLVYRSDVDGDPELYAARFDGADPVQLTVNGGFDSAPAWSPDGKRIAFERGDPGADVENSPASATMELWSMAAGGGDEQQLTSNGVHDEGPAWAPDGSGAIVFTREVGGKSDLWIREANGTERQLTAEPASSEESPDWQPVRGTAPVRASTAPAATVLLISTRVRVSKTGVVAVKLRSPTGYRGPVSLTRKGSRLALGQARLRVGKTTVVRLRLTPKALRQLRTARQLKVRLRPADTHFVLLAPR
jgi:dipeptidyl aminopeptidase/acylaminoacyl peptidase